MTRVTERAVDAAIPVIAGALTAACFAEVGSVPGAWFTVTLALVAGVAVQTAGAGRFAMGALAGDLLHTVTTAAPLGAVELTEGVAAFAAVATARLCFGTAPRGRLRVASVVRPFVPLLGVLACAAASAAITGIDVVAAVRSTGLGIVLAAPVLRGWPTAITVNGPCWPLGALVLAAASALAWGGAAAGPLVAAAIVALLLAQGTRCAMWGVTLSIVTALWTQATLRATGVSVPAADVDLAWLLLVMGASLVVLAEAYARWRRSAREREEHVEHFHALLDASADWIWVIDPTGTFTYVSRSAEQFAGGPLIGKSVEALGPNYGKRVREKLLAHGVHPQGVYRFTNVLGEDDAAVTTVETTAEPLFDTRGRLAGYRGFDRDITAAKQAEAHQVELRGAMAEVDKMLALGTLVRGVAHEVNNPNHAIMLNSAVLREIWRDVASALQHDDLMPHRRLGNLPVAEALIEVPQMLREMIAGSERIKRVITDLQTYSGRGPETFEPADPAEILESALSLIRGYVRRHTRSFEVEVERPLPRIQCKVPQIQQAWINLLMLACRSLPAHESEVRVRLAAPASMREVVFSVEVDVDAATPGFVADGEHLRGLAIARNIIEEHSGTVQSEHQGRDPRSALVTLPAIRPVTVSEPSVSAHPSPR